MLKLGTFTQKITTKNVPYFGIWLYTQNGQRDFIGRICKNDFAIPLYTTKFIPSQDIADIDNLFYSTNQLTLALHHEPLDSTFCSHLDVDQFADILKSRLCEHIVFGSVNQICGSTDSVDSP